MADEELIKLLNEQPKKNEYNIDDIFQINSNFGNRNQKPSYNRGESKETNNAYQNKIFFSKSFQTISEKPKAMFRLENKKLKPFAQDNNADTKYLAVQKLHNLLYSRPQVQTLESIEYDDEKKELLFDVLVAQLKALCCKRNKSEAKSSMKSFQLNSLLKELVPQKTLTKDLPTNEATSENKNFPREYIFLIINDEINSDGDSDIIYVDPESLQRNSSALLLGPITNQMTDTQLKLAVSITFYINRIL